jgi:HK97 family phage major capsid protein
LPQGVQSVNVPVLTVGATTTVIADDTAEDMVDITDTSTSSPVVTIAGYVDASQQLLDQSPQGAHFDSVMFSSLTESYNAVLEAQLFNGSGSSGQLQGILGLSGINNVTYTNASPTATGLFTILGEAVAAVGDNRKQPPEKWYLTTSRGAWIATSEDTTLRPLMLAGSSAPGEFQLAQYPVRLSDAIPINLGTCTNQDAIVLCKPSDMLLLESAPHMRTMFDIGADTESSSDGTLTVRVELHRYVAAIIGRYPTGIAVIQGTGLVTQSGF